MDALFRIVAGTSDDADLLIVEDEATRAPEPVLVTGLALGYATRDDTESVRRVTDLLTVPDQRATAVAAVAAHLLGVPAHLDLAATADDEWAISVLRVLALHALPAATADHATAKDLVHQLLGTAGWYRALPVLAGRVPDAVHVVVDVLDHHREVKGTATS
ncbi:hypothetical protein ACQEVS_27365 [Streptomyces sp. CA-181903]|uniref:hypothetical protein n=1 Tax=Streptomyces sp. CA-181903 TaxID=3240055 RepID=UPI003D93E5AC